MDSTSVSLLRRLREPQADSAWRRFVDLYAPLIFHWGCQKGLNETDAADLVQDVLITLTEKLPKFEYDPSQRFRGWLRTIAVNQSRDLKRRNDRRPINNLDSVLRRMQDVSDSDLIADADYNRHLVHRTLLLLQAEFRETTWQAAWQQLILGHAASDVAKQFNLSINAVYLAKSRLLARLREELEGLLD